MVQDDRRYGSLGVHHEAFRQLDADLAAVDEAKQRGLVRQLGTGRIPDAVALAAIAGLEAVGHRDLGRIGKAPSPADLAVQPLGRAFRRLDGERLQRMAEQVFPGFLELLGPRAHAFASRRDPERYAVASPAPLRGHEVGDAEPLSHRLSRERERGDRPAGLGDVSVLPSDHASKYRYIAR